MSDFEVEVINQPSGDLTVLMMNGVVYLYWLAVYKSLGITSNHARKIIPRLTEGKHYISFTKQEFKEKYPTVYKLDTVDKRASNIIFLTQEGFNRAITEFQTQYMDNEDAIRLVNEKRDEMAHVFTLYQRGELEQIEAPVIKKIQDKRDIGTNLSKQIGRVVQERLMPEYVRKGLNPYTAFSHEHRAINTITNGEHEADLKNKLNSDGLDVQNAAKLLEVGFIEAGLLDDETRWGNTKRTIDIIYPSRFINRIKLNDRELALIKRGCTENQMSLGEFRTPKRIAGGC